MKFYGSFSVLNIVLALISFTEIILCMCLLVFVPDVLYYTDCHIATASGLVASLLSFPTSFKIKFSVRAKILKEWTHIRLYQNFLLIMSITAHILAAIMAISGAAKVTTLKWTIMSSMSEYHGNLEIKSFVDKIQWNLNCCGMTSFEDWYNIDWEQLKNIESKHELSYAYIGDSEESAYRKRKRVPFSCCSSSSVSPCRHYNLDYHGTETINTAGCVQSLQTCAITLLLIECALYLATTALMSCMLCLLVARGCKRKSCQGRTPRRRSALVAWDNFTNSTSHIAELAPSSHSELRAPPDLNPYT